MKKVVVLFSLIISLLMVSVAFAEDIDLSGMTTEELVQLQSKVNEALWKSEKWNEVSVPVGVYKVGKEIPAGEWQIERSVDDYTYFRVYNKYQGGDLSDMQTASEVETPQKIMVVEGQYIEISYHPIIFKTYVPSFTFK